MSTQRPPAVLANPWGSPQLTAEETGLVEAPPIALDLFRVVNGLFAGSTFCTSAPVWHGEDSDQGQSKKI